MPAQPPKPEAQSPVRVAAIMSKPRSEQAVRVVPELLKWLQERGIGVRMDAETAGYAGSGTGLPREEAARGAQLLIVLGGDGTLLSAARALAGSNIPVFAVNLGNLGFLTSIKVDDLYPQLERVLAGNASIGQRRLLHAELWREGVCSAQFEALNDVAIAKVQIARMIELEVQVDGHFMCLYRADGLIVATPTGSTAYSLSAGGPIVFPTVAALSITPICPHTLTNRPVIVPDTAVIEINVTGSGESTYLTVDGQVGEQLKTGDRVRCLRSEHCVGLVQPPDLMYFDVLREKLKWGGP